MEICTYMTPFFSVLLSRREVTKNMKKISKNMKKISKNMKKISKKNFMSLGLEFPFREQIAPGLLTMIVLALLLEAPYLGQTLDIKLGFN